LNPGARRATQPLLLHKLYQPLAVISSIAQAASRFFNDASFDLAQARQRDTLRCASAFF